MSNLFVGETGVVRPHVATDTPIHPRIQLKSKMASVILQVPQLLLVALVLICLLVHVWWPDPSRAAPPRPLKPDQPRRKRSKEPKPFTK
jgi:hypothetical protein